MVDKLVGYINNSIRTKNGDEIALLYDLRIRLNPDQSSPLYYLPTDSARSAELINKIYEKDYGNALSGIISSVFIRCEMKEILERYVESVTITLDNIDRISPKIAGPILKTSSRMLHRLGCKLEETKEDGYRKCIDTFRKLFHNTCRYVESRYNCLLYVINYYLSLLFMRNQFNYLEILFNDSRKEINLDLYPDEEVSKFLFYKGRFEVYKCNTQDAYKYLTYCISKSACLNYMRRRLVFLYLIPALLAKELIPDEDMLKKLKLDDVYGNIVKHYINCDIGSYEKALRSNQLLYIQLGLYDALINVKIVIYLRLLRICYRLFKGNELPLELIQDTFNMFIKKNDGKVSINECEAILISIINNQNINCYIDHKQKHLVFKKDELI